MRLASVWFNNRPSPHTSDVRGVQARTRRVVGGWLAHVCPSASSCTPSRLRQVVRDGDGVLGLVDYATADDMATAIKKLDDTEFRNPYDK